MSKWKRRMLQMTSLLILAIAISSATAYFLAGSPWAGIRAMALAAIPAVTADEHGPDLMPTRDAKPLFADLESFTVTLYGDTRNRILYAQISLRLSDLESRQTIDDYMPEIRDRIISVLSSQDPEELRTARSHRALAQAVHSALSRPLSDPSRTLDIAEVLFTAFVVQ